MAEVPSAALPSPGDTVAGKYRIERLIGQGGMGAVYAAEHLALGRQVAIKVLLSELAGSVEAVARFQNEARNSARLQNDHVARVADVGTAGALAYMELELLDGEDLAQMLARRGPLPYPEAIGYVLQALEGVQHAHAMGIVHRDLKPSNLFLARRPDGSSIVKILDFGISKAQNPLDQPAGALTSTKAMLGSPLYMSPEQLRSSKTVDAQADIWALGVILFELLTGTVPFIGENLGELFAAILEQEPPSLCVRVPGTPPELDAIVTRCLRRQKDQRFASALELARALRPFATGPGTVALSAGPPLGMPPPGLGYQTGPHPPQSSQSSGGFAPARPGAVTPAPTLPLQAMSPMAPLPGGAATGAAVSVAKPGMADSGYTVPRRSSAGLIAVAAGALLALGVAGGGIFAYTTRASARPGPDPSASTSTSPPPVDSLAAPTSASAPPPVASATPSATAETSATSAATPPTASPHGHPAVKPPVRPTVVGKPEPPKPEPPKPEPPKPVVVAPKPPVPKPTSTLQTSR